MVLPGTAAEGHGRYAQAHSRKNFFYLAGIGMILRSFAPCGFLAE
jgi:hypothetical protein